MRRSGNSSIAHAFRNAGLAGVLCLAAAGAASAQSGGAAIPARAGAGELTAPPRNSFVVGGEPTTIERHPWQVALLIKGPAGLHLCGGAMISEWWIITAAHCFHGLDDPTTRVRSGVTDLHDLSTSVSMDQVITHADFDPDSFQNDIALVKTREPLTGKPVRLPGSDYVLRPGAELEVTGWGATAEAGQGSDVLMRAEVPLVPNDECNATDAYNGRVRPGMICAGREDGGVDACQGDSGGPLVDYTSGSPVLVGVVSWGEGCARERRYGVYTEVSLFESWIKRTILKAEGG